MGWEGLIKAYREFMPKIKEENIVTLKEGNTPLYEAVNLQKLFPGIKIYLKYEGLNPTGSFKDRGMTVAVSQAKEEGSNAVVCASTGNTSASAAAYAAKAGLKSIVLIPGGKIALGKLAQAIAYGAKVIAIDGNFDDALRLVREISQKFPITLVNSINPYRLEGQKTASFEICDELKDAPSYVALPVGNAGNITAYWMGFKEYYNAKRITRLPKMLGFQAAGAAPIVENRVIEKPETIATAIRIGNPASWEKAVAARDESGGLIDKVTDEEILEAYALLAKSEGIFAEPASAASIAGVIKKYKEGFFKEGESVVCVLTGNGLKDPDTAVKLGGEIKTIEANLKALEEVLYGE
ncbi:threonine synthase [Thermoanaerobacter brockii subsp. lactiethylicus]|jgi:threonine synthase|uniref:Threonine synthase n=2 Tax=Thermoanaerobacter TaxID=1754 RepID=B0KBD5_THEP3|nr:MULTISPECIES: threonine synthase [Thermoanaerobacter]ABY93573.1 threonine synthase [Thermoanaerobacter sp. X514]ABY93814.1 threonine synthase [Thermoanaerobacter pseudethanolicus ATCC 33223]ADV78776.1 threonine synthase [Thermoanaerobacter brockii subsp. finnii Ako-1]MBZ4655877.1 threonine synthase [Thermoanaerobacter sp.]MDI3500358.1 threonine synthase [Thermoanaerobacter sp.]